ncbi:uncharacterized protein DUF4037 [Humibacillus xanthopallidus]|uniref:Uncharacterized protein DUF4037 n=1 Tax=Humibacillus xanthopallidus TaxID=412689 RepID=A0A543PUV9_9MICO|nr:DUF4037 domain-containing protein [Humibacillus xanthopallidus]TQN47850.1 uncharacterized protein DUF4037 [Humibacillus xanthopallidus]
MDLTGAELSRAYFTEVVEPLLRSAWPTIPYAAARLGSGSDVLGLDDATSRDHDWGLRLNLLVAAELVDAVDAHLERHLPETFAGHPVRFATTWDPAHRHRVQVETARDLAVSRLGVDPTGELTPHDWLSLTGQAVLEVTGGVVFADHVGELDGIRQRLEWYPDDLWRHVVAVDWARLAQELPFVGRTGERGDELGCRVVVARLAGVAMHLGHLLERRWPPYAKWLGTSFAGLPLAGAAAPPLLAAVSAPGWRGREAGLVEALRLLSRVQAETGLPAVDGPVDPFWNRPYQGVRDEAVTVVTDSIRDPAVRSLTRGVGSAEQWSDNVDVLMDARRRRQTEG